MLGFFKLKYFFLSSGEQKGQNPNKGAENNKSASTLHSTHNVVNNNRPRDEKSIKEKFLRHHKIYN